MINIIKATTDDKKAIFRMTRGNSVAKMQDAQGMALQPTAWVLYEDITAPENGDEVPEVKTVLTVDVDGDYYGTISPTFIGTFQDMTNMLGDLCAFKVCTGNSKNGRKFIFPDPV